MTMDEHMKSTKYQNMIHYGANMAQQNPKKYQYQIL